MQEGSTQTFGFRYVESTACNTLFVHAFFSVHPYFSFHPYLFRSSLLFCSPLFFRSPIHSVRPRMYRLKVLIRSHLLFRSLLKVKVKYFLRYLEHQTDDSPLYIFDSHFDDHEVAKGLLEDFHVPSYFPDDLFSLVGERRRPPYRCQCRQPRTNRVVRWLAIIYVADGLVVSNRRCFSYHGCVRKFAELCAFVSGYEYS